MKKNIFIIVCIILAVTCLFSGCSKVETTDTKGEENVSLKNEGANYPFEIITSKDIIEAEIIMEDGGVIKLDLYPEIAPITVSNFVYLANEKFYDGLIFHRVIEGFMIQGGCPNGIGTGGPNYRIKGEFTANGVENTLAHTRGVVSMARSSSMDSAGSQFFIMHMDASHLDGQYAAFGRVTEGMEVVDKIATCETDSNDKPVKDIVIKTIKINKKSSEEPVKENKEEKKVNADKDKAESVTLKDGNEKAEEKTSITEDKNAETKKTESKVTEEKKTEDKKSENKVTEDKKTEDKKSENKVTEDKKTEDKKSENKVTEDKKTEDKKSENKVTEDKKTEDKKTENKATEDKKTQDKKNDEKSVNNENKKEETSKKDGKTEEKVKSDVEKAAEDLGIDLDNMPLTTFELTD